MARETGPSVCLNMSTPSRRRNHSLASCEPCRKSKTRCDHRKPICASCQRRGLQCWYHPAPMTKQRNSQRPTISTPPGSNRVVQNEVSSSANSPSTGTPMFHTWPFLSADPNDSASRVLITGGHGHDRYQDDGFTREMGWYGNLSLRLARELAPETTDLMIWLAHENLQLTTLFEGDASLGAWRRVGDLATDLLALGLNREATYSATPFFLAECRRRSFVRAYYLDKVFAAVFNRPPRITARHADCNLPLDLSDNELFTSSDKIEQAKDNLTQDGWNTDGEYRTATWARIRYILAEFREETIEYQYRSIQPTDAIKLRDLSTRCYIAWNGLPHYLQYRQDCWTSNLPPTLCHMHAKVYLSYLHIHFQVYRLLGNGDGNKTLQPELLEVSANMLETVVQMTSCRARSSSSPRDLPGIILAYGLPCAAILSTALETFFRDSSKGSHLLPDIKISTLIRNLSVLGSQLETVSSPSETNHVFCIKASKAISRKLDRILDNFTTAGSTKTPDRLLEPVPTLPTLYSSSTTTITDIDTTGFVDFDHFDLADWAINFDLGTMSDEWNMF